MSLQAYYLFEETDDTGGIRTQSRIQMKDIQEFLIKVHEIPYEQLIFALQVTADNPGVPYNLYKPTNDGNFGWVANLTLKVEYYRGNG